MDSERLLLVRPCEGLNDMLCQIAKCHKYAKKFNRVVIVDSAFRGKDYVFNALEKYFVSLSDTLILDFERYKPLTEKLAVKPAFVSGRVNNYVGVYKADGVGFVETVTGQRLTFDFSRDHQEGLLLHHACGGGDASMKCLSQMRIQPAILDEIFKRVQAIGRPYNAFHIRNTDFKTAYLQQIKKLGDFSPDVPLFVATDSRKALQDLKANLPRHQIFSFSELPENDNQPLHKLITDDSSHQRSVDALCDLIMLSLARKFRYSTAIGEVRYLGFIKIRRTIMRSGYARLAQLLKRKPAVLNTLLTTEMMRKLAPYR